MDIAPRLQRERRRLLHETIRLLEWPMAALGVIWLVLLVVDLTRGLPAPLVTLKYAIWVTFVLDFMLEIAVAPRKLLYLRKHWLARLSPSPLRRCAWCGSCDCSASPAWPGSAAA